VSDGVTSAGEAPTPFYVLDPKTPLQGERYLKLAGRQSISPVKGNVSINSLEDEFSDRPWRNGQSPNCPLPKLLQ